VFLPYSYDLAGPFKILPTERSAAVAGADGEVVDITVREGDWVSAGQVIAQLSSTEQRRNVMLARQSLARAEARLAQLDGRRSNSELAAAEPVRALRMDDNERTIALSEVERLHRQLEDDEARLELTTIRAPTAGFVTTPNAQLMTGVWLNAGDQFLQIENTKVVEAEIEIPQGDIALVKEGAKVRLRPWSEADHEIVGRVTALVLPPVDKPDVKAELKKSMLGNAAPARRPALAEAGRNRSASDGSLDSGTLPVKASVASADTVLRTAMTGYAKIDGPRMTVGEAYFRTWLRFLRVELWSWIP